MYTYRLKGPLLSKSKSIVCDVEFGPDGIASFPNMIDGLETFAKSGMIDRCEGPPPKDWMTHTGAGPMKTQEPEPAAVTVTSAFEDPSLKASLEQAQQLINQMTQGTPQ